MGHGATGCECSRHGEQHDFLTCEDRVRADVFRPFSPMILKFASGSLSPFAIVMSLLLECVENPFANPRTTARRGSRKQASMVATSGEFNTLGRAQREGW